MPGRVSAALGLAAALLAGCSMAPAYQRQAVAVPQDFKEAQPLAVAFFD